MDLPGMRPELFDRPGPEGVAGGDEDVELVLQQPEADLGQVGGLPDPVHPAEGHHIRTVVGFGLK